MDEQQHRKVDCSRAMHVGMQRRPPTSQTEPSRLLLPCPASVQPLRPATPHLQLPHRSARQGAAQLWAARLHRRHLLQQALRQSLQLQRNLRGEAGGKSASHQQASLLCISDGPGHKRRFATAQRSRFAPGAAPGSTGLGHRQGRQLGQDHPAKRSRAGHRVSAKGGSNFTAPTDRSARQPQLEFTYRGTPLRQPHAHHARQHRLTSCGARGGMKPASSSEASMRPGERGWGR